MFDHEIMTARHCSIPTIHPVRNIYPGIQCKGPLMAQCTRECLAHAPETQASQAYNNAQRCLYCMDASSTYTDARRCTSDP